ncbi:helicase-related protein [Ramlibacter sp. AN1133]|uniref:helicase-related protein n=1 Tax=Ramlibacter sp. AN1133 TaxID=3133429 RepID=UPI0030BE68E0
MRALGLQDPRHALLCAPATYVDCRTAHDTVGYHLLDQPGQLFRLCFTGRMRGFDGGKRLVFEVPSDAFPHPAAIPRNLQFKTRRTQLEMTDARGELVQLSMFTGPAPWLDVQAGQQVLVTGQLRKFGRDLTVSLELRVPDVAHDGIWTRYAGIPGKIAGERVQLLVAQASLDASAARHCAALAMGATGLREQNLMQACASASGTVFPTFSELLRALHKPTSVGEGHAALECARRISALAVQSAALRHHRRPAHPSAPLPVDPEEIQRVAAGLPHPLTGGQREVVHKIAHRLTEPVPLSGLLSGDVGTGKTLAFLVPAIAAHLAGARVAIISPMKLLADQIAREALDKFGAFVSNVERIEAGDRINDPQAILVGTTGLVSAARKAGYVPQFLICDEQHKQSTSTREALVGPGTHVLEVSATPVPRSLAATLYEGMEILNLRECPVQKTIHSHLIDLETRGQSVAAIRQALARGERAAMIYPRVTTDEEDTQSVEKAFQVMEAAFPGQVVMLHGQMGDDEIKRSIDTFRSGARRLVVASTVLEIGIDIPSVSVMVVRDADCFGISQLHQLRGRLVRNGGEGDFFMYVDDLSALQPETLERLRAVKRTSDGYELAEIDLVQRGFGDVDGEAQTGESQTLFRLIRLRVQDFMKRKLSPAQVEAAVAAAPARAPTRTLAQETAVPTPQPVQQRLL